MHFNYIQSHILRLCKQPRTFEFISKNLNGLDNIELHRTLSRLEDERILQKKSDMWSIKPHGHKIRPLSEDPKLYLKKYMGYFDFLKTPHPLDFEWRNSTASLNYLINQVQEMNGVNDKILFLGMPTLFASAVNKDIPQKVTLVEKNLPIVKGLRKLKYDNKRFKILENDIFEVKPNKIGEFHCVIMDPPWYTPHFKQFMWLAAQCVEIGGIVGISLPAINTRPNIDKERIEWLSFCQENGLFLENLFAQKLQYAMPFFEFNAFRAAGITDTYPFWRKGDFALFRKVHSHPYKRPKYKQKEDEWSEKEIDGVRFRLKDSDESSKGIIEFTSILNGDILPTVSTRDKRREEANFWTSGNRIFKVNNTGKLMNLLSNWNNKSFKKGEQEVINIIKTFIDFEKKEYSTYLEWLYHEMERQID